MHGLGEVDRQSPRQRPEPSLAGDYRQQRQEKEADALKAAQPQHAVAQEIQEHSQKKEEGA